MNEIIQFSPSVFAVKNEYQIAVAAECEAVMWVTINGKKYYDHSNGVMRSLSKYHKVSVPMAELDCAKEYTVTCRKVIERHPYGPELEEEQSVTYKFRPIEKTENIKIYHIADTHGNFEFPYKASQFFDMDLLILNGDIQDSSHEEKHFALIHRLGGEITHGEFPIVFSRGNHDLRGRYAETQAEFLPVDNGNSYYTFRIGAIWGMVLDCGEDKDDSHKEYGGTICCHEFRLAQTEFIKNVIKNKDTEYNADGVKYRLVIAHKPFTAAGNAPFDIEHDIYREWVKLLNENVKPHMLLNGHEHICKLCGKEDEKYDTFGLECPVVIGSAFRYRTTPEWAVYDFAGAAITLSQGEINIKFTNSENKIEEEHNIEYK